LTVSQPPEEKALSFSRVAGDQAPVAPALPPEWSIGGTPERPVLRVVDELELATCSLLRSALDDLIDADLDRLVELHLDLREVPFIDSIGIGVLVSTHLRLVDIGCQLVVMPSPALRTVLGITGLDQVMAVH
jgi:anti-sigma B factor antagonist